MPTVYKYSQIKKRLKTIHVVIGFWLVMQRWLTGQNGFDAKMTFPSLLAEPVGPVSYLAARLTSRSFMGQIYSFLVFSWKFSNFVKVGHTKKVLLLHG